MTVLKVIRIFLHQPVGNDINLVILNIIVGHITCKTTVLVNFDKQKLNNSKTPEKLTDNKQLLDEVEQNIVICQWRAVQLFADAEGRGK